MFWIHQLHLQKTFFLSWFIALLDRSQRRRTQETLGGGKRKQEKVCFFRSAKAILSGVILKKALSLQPFLKHFSKKIKIPHSLLSIHNI